jgi:hypothetical protein
LVCFAGCWLLAAGDGWLSAAVLACKFFVVWRCLCVELLVDSFLGLKWIKLACCPSAGLDALLCEVGWHFDWEDPGLEGVIWFLGYARFCAVR